MSAQNDGGPAFPVCTDFSRVNEGMTLRDWFAGQAMTGCARAYISRGDIGVMAERAYMAADAMLAAREAKQ